MMGVCSYCGDFSRVQRLASLNVACRDCAREIDFLVEDLLLAGAEDAGLSQVFNLPALLDDFAAIAWGEPAGLIPQRKTADVLRVPSAVTAFAAIRSA